MDIVDIFKILGIIVSMISSVLIGLAWIITYRIKPVEIANEQLLKDNNELKAKAEKIERLLLDELKQIAKDNFNFRQENEKSISELKLKSSETYVTKADFVREMTDVHKRVDSSENIKTILEALK